MFGVAAAIVVLDRITKLLAERFLSGRPPVTLIPGVLRLAYTTNAGGAFGLFGGLTWLFVTATVVVVALLVILAIRGLPSMTTAVSLGLVLGGAVGNLLDRVLRGPGFSGRVVDFIDFRVWPAFNLADSAIVIGTATLLIASLRRRPASDP